MSFFYAQLSDSDVVIGVSETHSEMDAADLVPIAEFPPLLLPQRWKKEAKAFEQGPPPAQPTERNVSRKAFLSRFTDAEAINIDMASICATRYASTVRRYLSKENAAQHIDLSYEETRKGVQALDSVVLLQPGRALAILDAPIQPKELP